MATYATIGSSGDSYGDDISELVSEWAELDLEEVLERAALRIRCSKEQHPSSSSSSLQGRWGSNGNSCAAILFKSAPRSLGNESNVSKSIDALLSVVTCRPHLNTEELAAVAAFVKEVAMSWPYTSNVLLYHLATLPSPLLFIEILPIVFSEESANAIVSLSEQLSALVERDGNSCLIAAISALVNLPSSLPCDVTVRLSAMVEEALAVVDETDLPMLFRTLLRSIDQLNGHKTIASIRREMASLSERAVAVVVEVLWDTLPSSRSASYLFVDQILREQDSACHELHNRSSSSGIGGAVTSSNLLDLAVLLIAAPVSGDINRKTLALVRGWLDRGAFPFGPLREVLGMRSQNEVWDRLTPSMWLLSLQAAEHLVERRLSAQQHTSNPCPGANDSSIGSGFGCPASYSLFELIALLFDSSPAMRAEIVGSLVGMCYSSGSSSSVGVITATQLPPLGLSARLLEASSKEQCDINDIDRQRLRAVFASSALLHLLCQGAPRVEVGLALLHSLSERCVGPLLALPSARVLREMLRGVAFVTTLSPQAESTVLILIQKLLSTPSRPDQFFLRVVSIEPHQNSATHIHPPSPASRQTPSAGALYTAAAVGTMLASHMLLGRGRALAEVDARAVLTWVMRVWPSMHDGTIVHAADLFSALLLSNEQPPSPRSSSSSSSASASRPPLTRGSLLPSILAFWTQYMANKRIAFTSFSDVPTAGRGPGDCVQQYFLVDCSSALPASAPEVAEAQPHSSGSGEQQLPVLVVWSPTSLAAELVLCCEKYRQAPHDVHLIRAVFWTVHRLAALYYRLAAASGGGRGSSCSAIQLAVNGDTVNVTGLLRGDGGSNKRGRPSMPAAAGALRDAGDLGNKLFVGSSLWSWPEGAVADALLGRRPAEDPQQQLSHVRAGASMDAAAQHSMLAGLYLALATERLLTAVILLAKMNNSLSRSFSSTAPVTGSSSSSSSGDDDDGDSRFAQMSSVCRILCQLACSRNAIRMLNAHTAARSSTTAGSPSKSGAAAAAKEQAILGGSKGSRGSPASTPKKKTAAPDADLENRRGSDQLRAIIGLLEVCDSDVPTAPLASCVLLMHSASQSSGAAADEAVAITPLWLTSAGLAVTSAFVSRSLDLRGGSDSDSAYDSFAPLAYPTPTIRSDESTTCRGGADPTLDGGLQASAEGRVIGGAHAAFLYIEHLRRGGRRLLRGGGRGASRPDSAPAAAAASAAATATAAPSSSDDGDPVRAKYLPVLGEFLDRDGASAALLLAYALADRRLAQLPMSPTRLQEPAAVALLSALSGSEPCPGGSGSALDVAAKCYYRLERHVLELQDALLASSCLRLLLRLSAGTHAIERCRAASWILSWAVFPDRLVIDRSAAAAVGDNVCGFLHGFAHSSPCYDRLMDEFAAAPASYRSVLRSTYSLFSSSGLTGKGRAAVATGSSGSADRHAIGSFWLCWLSIEDSQSRIYGCAFAIDRICRHFRKINSQDSTNASTRHPRKGALKRRRIDDDDDEYSDGSSDSDDDDEYSSHDGSSASSEAPNMSSHNSAIYFAYAISILPAAFIAARPAPPTSRPPACAATAEAASTPLTETLRSPYTSLIMTCQVYAQSTQWIIQALGGARTKKTIHRLLPYVVRVCRAVLDTLEISSQRCIDWRSDQLDDLGASSEQSRKEGSSYNPSDDEDWGSVDRLAEAFEWLLSAAQWTVRLSQALKSALLTTAAARGGALARGVPQLQLMAERAAAKIIRTARAHALVLDESNIDEEEIERCRNHLQTRISAFTASKQSATATAAQAELLWAPLQTGSSNPSLDAPSSSYSARTGIGAAGNVFAVQTTAGSGGWGLYSYDDDDDDDGLYS